MGGYFGDSGLSCFFQALFKPPPAFPNPPPPPPPRRYVVVWACEKARSINFSHVSSCFLSSVMNNRHENPAYLVSISFRAWVRPVATIHVSTVLVNDGAELIRSETSSPEIYLARTPATCKLKVVEG